MNKHNSILSGLTLVVALLAATTAGADTFVFSNDCGNSNWFSSCAGGPCAGGTTVRNNWGRNQCAATPPLPGLGDVADVGVNSVTATGGTVTAGDLLVAPGGVLTLTNCGINTGGGTIDGTFNFSGGANGIGTLTFRGTATYNALTNFQNLDWTNEGDFEVSGGNFSHTGGTAVFTNTGTFRKATGTSFVSIPTFVNDGSVRVEQGTLELRTRVESSSTAFWETLPGTSLLLQAATLKGPFDIANAGAAKIHQFAIEAPGATFAVNGAGLVISGNSTMAAGATMTNEAGGTMAFPVSFAIGSTGAGGTLSNLGQVNYSIAGTFTGITINNPGAWTISGASPNFSGGVGCAFNNSGTLALNHSGSFAVTIPINNSGLVHANSGTLQLFGGAPLTQSAGQTVLAGGGISGPGVVNLSGGTLRGVGTISTTVNNSAGAVQPGNSAGTLNVSSYSQAAGGTLEMELGGLTAGTQYDRLAVSGAASLNGTLAVSLINGFVPQVNDQFQVLTCSTRSGTFSTVTPPPGVSLDVIYASNSVTLRVTAVNVCEPCDTNCDGSVNLFDISSFVEQLGANPPAACSACAADANNDGSVNLFDISGFVDCLGG